MTKAFRGSDVCVAPPRDDSEFPEDKQAWVIDPGPNAA